MEWDVHNMNEATALRIAAALERAADSNDAILAWHKTRAIEMQGDRAQNIARQDAMNIDAKQANEEVMALFAESLARMSELNDTMRQLVAKE